VGGAIEGIGDGEDLDFSKVWLGLVESSGEVVWSELGGLMSPSFGEVLMGVF